MFLPSYWSLCWDRAHTVHSRPRRASSSIPCTWFFPPGRDSSTCCPPPGSSSKYPRARSGQALRNRGGTCVIYSICCGSVDSDSEMFRRSGGGRAPSVVLRLTQRRRVLSRTNGGLQKQLKDPGVFMHTPFSQALSKAHSS